MLKKQSIWFVTLFSLILVLSVYYITLPPQTLPTDKNTPPTEQTNKETTDKEKEQETSGVKDANLLTSLRLELTNSRQQTISDLEKIINDKNATPQARSDAQSQLDEINRIAGLETTLEKKVSAEINKDVFVAIDKDNIRVVLQSKEHSNNLANTIMRTVQSEFASRVNITVEVKSVE